MDRADTNSTTSEGKECPPVPIKTYRWEDVKRARLKGAYPWTHIQKGPFDDEIDPDIFTMEHFKKSKSASTLGTKSESGVIIQEISESENEKSEKMNEESQDKENVKSYNVLEVTDSSGDDNISQYLDKDGSGQNISQPGPSTLKIEEVDNNNRQERAKSEEPKRKRKLSIESSYSRISMKSLSKLGVIKRLKEAKNKIKIPKFPSFSKLDKRQKQEKTKTENTEVIEQKKDKSKQQPLKDEKPVYIHIPLKLPPGETDEFSKYADEEPISTLKEEKEIQDDTNTEIQETEESPTHDVHLIILTAPSDDEILEDASIPETPSEKDKPIDVGHMDVLKSLAKNVVDEFSPETKKDELNVIKEERSSEEKEVEKPVEIEVENVEEKTEITPQVEEIQESIQIEQESPKQEITKNKKGRKGKKKRTSDESKTEENEKEAEKEKMTINEKDPQNEKELEIKEKSVTENVLEATKTECEETSQEAQITHEQMMVDEEDGLKLSEKAIALINEELAKENLPKITESELKSSLKTQETPSSPIMKKKVSFKRKNKIENDNDDYEIIEVPKSEKVTLTPLESSQSMSVDEEKTYLDEKIIKSTSLEEDYNKWSKNLDHEYEPVNPPPEDDKTFVQQTVTNEQRKSPRKIRPSNRNSFRIPLHEDVIITSSGEEDNEKNGQDESAQEMQDRLETQYFSAPITDAKTTSSLEQQTAATTTQKKDGKSAMLTQIEGQGKKIKEVFNTQTGKFKTKIKGMKRPNISMPSKPKFDKAKIQRIKDSMPKMPDKSKFKIPKIPESTKINLPSFSLPKKSTATSKLKQRQFSTESNAGDSKMKIFDFSTYPRIFKGRKKDDTFDDQFPESSTVPRTKDTKKTAKDVPTHGSPVYIRIPLHSEESMERIEPRDSEQNGASHTRYNEDIDIDDAFVKENQEIHRASPFSSKYIERWKHGTFHAQTKKPTTPDDSQEHIIQRECKVTDLDNSDERTPSNGSVDPRMLTSGSLGDIHARGVIEEINEDEFFVRQKGISQDNIEVGEYLSSEIREAFKNPINPLRQMQDDSYDREYEIDISDQSIEESPKRKPIRKPKRKRTPHVSQEKIAYDQESITTEPEEYPKAYPPGRPKRRSKKGCKKAEEVIPYQETISVDKQEGYLPSEQFQLNLDDKHNGIQMYENEHMRGIEQPEIFVSNAFQQEYYQKGIDDFIDDFNEMPQVPARKHRSLKSLTTSEHDSIIGEYNMDKDFTSQEIETYRMEHEYIIPTPELEPPVRPRRSRTRSQSHVTPSVDGEEAIKDNESYLLDSQLPCSEPPCTLDMRDAMGYAIIDKSRQHEPPLPPPRIIDQPKTPPRRRRTKIKDNETKFFTVPRQLNDASVPIRPLRNYSTLGGNIGKKKVSLQNLTDEEKENVDISQYSEIPDDEQGRNLQSGDVVQKMKDRPLPAPPRPPRKTRGGRPFRDITNDDDIIANIEKEIIEEAEISTQTEPLPDDFECEEVVQESHDKILTPTVSFDNEETITHGSLVVQPLDNAQILPDSQLSRERIVPITREDHFYENEISEIPEDFLNLKSPEEKVILSEENVTSHKDKLPSREGIKEQYNTEIDTLKAQKLQVSDLDVDRLTVNELLANKIRVSEIDSGNIQVSEINSQGGNLIVSGIELPASFLQQLVDRIQNASPLPTTGEQEVKPTEKKDEQKKTSIEIDINDDLDMQTISDQLPERPPRSKTDDAESEKKNLDEVVEVEEQIEADVPERPPRLKHDQFNDPSESAEDSEHRAEIDDEKNVEFFPDFQHTLELRLAEITRGIMQESETILNNENEMPPPRPPQPFNIEQEDLIYLPSQPPPSFYSLRSPIFTEFIDDDIPLPPRRRRQTKQIVKESSSEETIPVQRRSRRRSRTPEASIPELAGQLTRACANAADRQFKRLITYLTNYVLDNADGKQDMHVTIVILLVLIASLILLGFGGGGNTIHHHHWEFFNPPKNL